MPGGFDATDPFIWQVGVAARPVAAVVLRHVYLAVVQSDVDESRFEA